MGYTPSPFPVWTLYVHVPQAKRRGLAEAASEAEARLESMASERRTLLEMNEDLSVAAQGRYSVLS